MAPAYCGKTSRRIPSAVRFLLWHNSVPHSLLRLVIQQLRFVPLFFLVKIFLWQHLNPALKRRVTNVTCSMHVGKIINRVTNTVRVTFESKFVRRAEDEH